LDQNDGLKDFYVIRDSGECVYHQSYVMENDKIEADQTIMSSFLSAIETFSSNVDLGAKMLETTNNRFIYHKDPKSEWLFVARTEKTVNPEDISSKLGTISGIVNSWLSKKFDGNVKIFQGVSNLIEEQFTPVPSQFFEITGKETISLSGIEEKVYSFLRFKGRSTISSISKLMRIPVQDAQNVTYSLRDKKYLTVCS
jgi:hypothetical protein